MDGVNQRFAFVFGANNSIASTSVATAFNGAAHHIGVVVRYLPVQACPCAGRPASVTFAYTAASCSVMSHHQQGRASCTSSGGSLSGATSASITSSSSSSSSSQAVISPSVVSVGQEFNVTGSNGRVPVSTTFVISDGTHTQNVTLDLSCGTRLAIGDVFGSLRVVNFTCASKCAAPVVSPSPSPSPSPSTPHTATGTPHTSTGTSHTSTGTASMGTAATPHASGTVHPATTVGPSTTHAATTHPSTSDGAGLDVGEL